jgi:ribosome maturation protein Sdo1
MGTGGEVRILIFTKALMGT